jgi:hypothetical protein
MGSFVFRWERPAKEVYVSGTFDDWSKSVKLVKLGDWFEKEVFFPKSEVIYYQFFVDDMWLVDGWWVQIDPIRGNVNVLTPDQLLPHVPASVEVIEDRKYPYEKLDFDTYEIRLLTLNWSNDEYSPIVGSLEHVSLIDPGPYFALSYCWGDASITRSITIGSHKIEVTPNLYAALRGVRKLTCLRLWVDALCINQGDNEERSNQVRNMRQIYSRAKEVICWVGNVDYHDLPFM